VLSHVAVVAEDEEGRERKRGRGGGPLLVPSCSVISPLEQGSIDGGLGGRKVFKTKAVDKVVVEEKEAVGVLTTSGIDFIRFRLLHEDPRYHAHVRCIFQDLPPVRAHVHFGQKSANQFDISETQNSTDGPSNDGGVHGVCPSSATSCVFRTISAHIEPQLSCGPTDVILTRRSRLSRAFKKTNSPIANFAA
jgi:hypothetical protein